MSNVNFHQYFSAELKEFHAILVYQQESHSRKIKENSDNSEFDETETLVKLKESIDTASNFFRGFSDLLAEGKMEKIKMNIEAILSFINNSNNTYMKDYTKLFDEALERLDELSMIVEPTIKNDNGEIVFQKNIEAPYDVAYAINTLKSSSFIFVGLGFAIIFVVNLFVINLIGEGFIESGVIILLNVIYLFGIVFGFRAISTKLLKLQLAEESDQTIVNNIGKLISDHEVADVNQIAYENINAQERILNIRKKREQDNAKPKNSFDRVARSSIAQTSEKNRGSNHHRSTSTSTSTSSTTHSNYDSFHSSSFTSNISDSSNDSSSSSSDSGTSSGSYD